MSVPWSLYYYSSNIYMTGLGQFWYSVCVCVCVWTVSGVGWLCINVLRLCSRHCSQFIIFNSALSPSEPHPAAPWGITPVLPPSLPPIHLSTPPSAPVSHASLNLHLPFPCSPLMALKKPKDSGKTGPRSLSGFFSQSEPKCLNIVYVNNATHTYTYIHTYIHTHTHTHYILVLCITSKDTCHDSGLY